MLQSVMLKKQYITIAFLACSVLSACITRQTQIPTPLPSFTPPSSPTSIPATETAISTSTSEIVETATAAATATPLPICNPGKTVESGANGSIPSYIDILNASTKLSGSHLTVTFAMNWLPDQIMIDRNILAYGSAEIAWGVAVDVDNDPGTGSSIALTNSGYGYEYVLQAVNFKEGDEKQGDIQSLFNDKTSVWETFPDGSSTIHNTGKFKVDTATASITLNGDIKGIKKDSYLHFFAVYYPTASQQMTDELCQR